MELLRPVPPSDDDDLAAHAQAGDEAALGELARRWYPAIRRWALGHLGDPVLQMTQPRKRWSG